METPLPVCKEPVFWHQQFPLASPLALKPVLPEHTQPSGFSFVCFLLPQAWLFPGFTRGMPSPPGCVSVTAQKHDFKI